MKKYIILHHSAIQDEKPQAERVKAEHLVRFKQPGSYHYFLERDGLVVKFREEDTIGYHAGNWFYNVLGIGICLAGDLRPGHQDPTDQQMLDLKQVITSIQSRWNIPDKNILLHSEVRIGGTACPGRDLRLLLEQKLTPQEKQLKIASLQNALRWAFGSRQQKINEEIERLSKN